MLIFTNKKITSADTCMADTVMINRLSSKSGTILLTYIGIEQYVKTTLLSKGIIEYLISHLPMQFLIFSQ